MKSQNNFTKSRRLSDSNNITLDEAIKNKSNLLAEEFHARMETNQLQMEEQSDEITMLKKEVEILSCKYSDLFDNSPVGYIALDLTGKIIDINNTLTEMLGTAKVFLVGNVIQNIIYERDIDLFYGYVRKLKTTKTKHSLDIRVIRNDRSYMDAKFEGKLQFCSQYNADVIRVAVIDNTVAKIFETTLRQNESKYRSLVEGLDDAIFKIRMPGGKFEYISPSASDVFGHPIESLFQGFSFLRTKLHHESILCFDEFFDNLLSGVIASSCEYRIIDSNDKTRWILQTNTPIYNPDGSLAAIEGICRNISERKHIEKKIIDSEERFKAISNHTHDWEMWISPDGEPLWINPSVERITGYTIDECFNMPNYPMALVCKEDIDHVLGNFIKVMEKQTDINGMDFRITQKDGSICWVSGSWTPIYFSDDSYQGYRISIRDISEKKDIEDKLHILIEDLRQSNEIINKQVCQLNNLKLKLESSERLLKQLNVKKDEFVSKISHNLIHSLTSLIDLAHEFEKENDAGAIEILINDAGHLENHIKESIAQIEEYFKWAQSSQTLQ